MMANSGERQLWQGSRLVNLQRLSVERMVGRPVQAT